MVRNCLLSRLCKSSAVKDLLRTKHPHHKEPKMNSTVTDEIAEPNSPSYEVARFNAIKHGILSRYTVLSHENHPTMKVW